MSMVLFAFAADNRCMGQNQPAPVNRKTSFSLAGKISLDSLTKYVHQSSKIRFSFNSVKVNGSREIIFPAASYSFVEILQQIKKTTSLYYSFHAGYVIFQDNPPVQHLQKTTSQENKKAAVKTPRKKNQHLQPGKSEATGRGAVQEIGKRAKSPAKPLAKPRKETNGAFVFNKPGRLATHEKKDSNTLLSYRKPGTGYIDLPKVIKLEKDSVLNWSWTNAVLQERRKSFFAVNRIDTVRKSNTLFPLPAGEATGSTKKKVDGLHAGLQWNLKVPVYGVNGYFTGTNGNSQLYNLFIPGLWVSKNLPASQNEILFFVNAGQEFFTGNKSVSVTNGVLSLTDSTSVQRNAIIIKTSTISAGLQYNYHINDRWVAAAGFGGHWQYAALGNQQTISLRDGSLLSDSLYGISKSSADWKYFQPFFVTGKIEVAYGFKNMQAGMSFLVPVTNIFQSSSGSAHPVNLFVFMRWRIK